MSHPKRPLSTDGGSIARGGRGGKAQRPLCPHDGDGSGSGSGGGGGGGGADDGDKTSEDFGPLTSQQIRDFVRDGYVLLKHAFDPAVAEQCREQLWLRLLGDGIHRNDTSTWAVRHGIPEIYDSSYGEPWRSVWTGRLIGAIDQLCGRGRWEGFGFGWWVITFPQQEEGPWGTSGHWHVDGASYTHYPHSKESGLLPIFLFSDIGPGEGGTALSVGSHKRTARVLWEHASEGLPGGDLSRILRAQQKHGEESNKGEGVVEVRGEAGDVMLTHPFIFHARSKNLGCKGEASVRFMCNPNVRLKEDMVLDRSDRSLYSPVELAIVEGKELHCNRKGKDERSTQTCQKPQL